MIFHRNPREEEAAQRRTELGRQWRHCEPVHTHQICPVLLSAFWWKELSVPRNGRRRDSSVESVRTGSILVGPLAVSATPNTLQQFVSLMLSVASSTDDVDSSDFV